MAEIIPPVEDLLKQAKDEFYSRFSCVADVAACAPGRVNLIGEHTDYNNGYVLPMALPLVTVVVGRANDSRLIKIITLNEQADKPWEIEIRVSDIVSGEPKWANYVKGAIAFFRGLDPGNLPGFEAIITSSVPFGGGVSSSAALEVAMYTFLEALTGRKAPSPETKALRCQEAEHIYAGMPCGIMDQFISVMGKAEHALLIDCKTNSSTLVPLKDPNYVILVTNSNVKHELTGGEYASRRAQCEIAAKVLSVSSLREAEEKSLEVLKDIGVEEVIVRRARHVITEIKRTIEGADALQKGDYVKFGQLMTESHESLRDDYEVSCQELDRLVDAALQVKGVLGSRMTGGGFGGCTVTLVKSSHVDEAIHHIKEKYPGTPTFYVVRPADGCRELALKCACP